ncbi:BZ3500_MvSof-1268-A1-R1_Chr4-3g07275 [Microbotryum saponariae]|uniref:ferroxidase n=1 Tax=Microbotryum saponariae TaxID=289078 RepID=A0A2X0LNR0_9BASI|nr:BZ3500_MvSof-1268-A1-R1_Chr4-3g07275 [Microbotryum saponariae]SDA06938.1 BZ3501_MvSof-1269-A2-R1_Chr4-2g06984 [Microbotryum saponariae]
MNRLCPSNVATWRAFVPRSSTLIPVARCQRPALLLTSVDRRTKPRGRADVGCQTCRCFGSMAKASSASASATSRSYAAGPLTIQAYQKAADQAMDKLTDYFEELVEAAPPELKYDVEYSSGVLTLHVGDKGTYVINKQPPNQQIWLSSPSSGPKRYDYDPHHGVWFYHRDGTLLEDLLTEELRNAMDDPSVHVTLSNP